MARQGRQDDTRHPLTLSCRLTAKSDSERLFKSVWTVRHPERLFKLVWIVLHAVVTCESSSQTTVTSKVRKTTKREQNVHVIVVLC